MEALRSIEFYEDYFKDFYFYKGLSAKAQEKIDDIIEILLTQRYISQKHVKHITNSEGIYEMIASVGSNEYRVLFFFKEGDLISGGTEIVFLNGFLKKSKKDYPSAVKKAELLKSQYINSQQ